MTSNDNSKLQLRTSKFYNEISSSNFHFKFKLQQAWEAISLGKIGLNWALTGSNTNRGKLKNIFKSYSLSLASFVYWSELNSSSFILVKCLIYLNKMKLGYIELNWAKTELSTYRVKFQNVFEVTLLS